jgi:hypothetical protein
MGNSKKHSMDEKKQDAVQEPAIIYGTDNDLILSRSEKSDIILGKLIEKSIQDSKEGKGISHEEMMRRVKLRYPFLK